MASTGQIAALRRFNRFYTRRIGVLEEGLHGSPFSLAEARVLHEIAGRDKASATELRAGLGIDQGYLSRLIDALAKRGAVSRTRSDRDGRRLSLALTTAGRAAYARLDRAADEQANALLQSLSAEDRDRLVAAMARVEQLLGGSAAPPAPWLLRPPRPGDLGWIVHRHGAIYAEEFGFDETFEGFVAEIVGRFAKSHDPRREACWIAERDGQIAGAAMLARESEHEARLRLLYVERAARGMGIGAKLVATCIDQARRAGYATLSLWTNDVLTGARRLYEHAGFVLVRETPHRSFGKDLVGQDWSLEL